MKKKNFYLKKISKRGKIDIWIVDGNKIRSNLDKEFTNFGHHFLFKYIPEYEFWLDKEATPNERHFFISYLLTEWQLQKNGMLHKKARAIAKRKERAERKKSEDFQKIIKKGEKKLMSRIHIRLLHKIKDISIWLVAGKYVRSAFDLDFTEGGHDYVYKYVPKKEVWIDNDLQEIERPYVVLHELYERSLMKKGLNYNEAHRRSSQLEWVCRHNEKLLKKNLDSLGWK